MPRNRRTKKLIHSRLQLRLIAVFLTLSGASALFQVALLNRSLLKLVREVTESGSLETLTDGLPSVFVANLAWTIGLLTPLMLCIGILATHRIAGPAYRMRKHCEEIALGGELRKCSLRKGDELHELCDALNRALQAVAWQKEHQPSDPVPGALASSLEPKAPLPAPRQAAAADVEVS